MQPLLILLVFSFFFFYKKYHYNFEEGNIDPKSPETKRKTRFSFARRKQNETEMAGTEEHGPQHSTESDFSFQWDEASQLYFHARSANLQFQDFDFPQTLSFSFLSHISCFASSIEFLNSRVFAWSA